MEDRVLGLLGLARRGGMVTFGDNVLPLLSKKRNKFVIIASNASDNTKKKWIDKCTYYQCEYVIYSSKELLAQSIGMNEVAVIGLFEPKLITKVKNLLKEGDIDGTK